MSSFTDLLDDYLAKKRAWQDREATKEVCTWKFIKTLPEVEKEYKDAKKALDSFISKLYNV